MRWGGGQSGGVGSSEALRRPEMPQKAENGAF